MPVAKKTVYLNADRTKAVPEGSDDAAFLLAREGTFISAEDATQYKVSTHDESPFDAVADHAAKHGGETDAEAKVRRSAMFNKAVKGPPADK